MVLVLPVSVVMISDVMLDMLLVAWREPVVDDDVVLLVAALMLRVVLPVSVVLVSEVVLVTLLVAQRVPVADVGVAPLVTVLLLRAVLPASVVLVCESFSSRSAFSSTARAASPGPPIVQQAGRAGHALRRTGKRARLGEPRLQHRGPRAKPPAAPRAAGRQALTRFRAAAACLRVNSALDAPPPRPHAPESEA